MKQLNSFSYKRTFRLLAFAGALMFSYIFFLHLFHPSSFNVTPAATGPYKVLIDSLTGASLATLFCVGLINTINMFVLFSDSTGQQTLTIILGILFFIPLLFLGILSLFPMLIYSGIRYKILNKREHKQNNARYVFIQPYFDQIQEERKSEIKTFLKQYKIRSIQTTVGWYAVLIVSVIFIAWLEIFGVLISVALVIGYLRESLT